MLNICEKSHIATIINSLDKIYRQSKINGELNPLDIYYINIIYKLLYYCDTDITNKERNQLINIYNNISFKSDNICYNTNIEVFHLNTKITFVQSDCDDCDNEPVELSKIYYWQEENPVTTINDILPLVDEDYLADKLFDTLENFEIGKTISYTNIGRIGFIITNSETIDYELQDILGNNITEFFDFIVIDDLKYTLIVSKNIYTFGDAFIKIIKGDLIINPGSFDETFDDEFY